MFVLSLDILNFRRVLEFTINVKFTGELVKDQSNSSLRTVFDGSETIPQRKNSGKRVLRLARNLLHLRIDVDQICDN